MSRSTTKWSTTDIPDQTGRIAIVTGANTGLGLETAKALAAHGAHVVLAVRNAEKGKAAAEAITATTQTPMSPCSHWTFPHWNPSAGPVMSSRGATTRSIC